MPKEKTIPDPPAHIKRWIDDEWNRDAEWNEGNRPKYSFRLGASIMHQKCEEEKEEHAVGFLDWINENEFIRDGEGFWYELPMFVHEGKYGMCVAISNEQLYKIYIESLTKTPSI